MTEINEKNTRRYRNIGTEIRQLIIRKAVEGQTVPKISMELELPIPKVNNIAMIFFRNGTFERETRGCDKRSKLSAEQKNSLREWIDENPAITLDALKSKVL